MVEEITTIMDQLCNKDIKFIWLEDVFGGGGFFDKEYIWRITYKESEGEK